MISDIWFRTLQKRPHAKLNLLCFPYAGGSVSVFRDWAKYFTDEVEITVLNLPGRDERFNEPLQTHLSQLMNSITEPFIKFTNRPYILLGYSMGGRVAFELASFAAKNKLNLPKHLIECASRPPHFQNIPPRHHLPDKEFLESIKDVNGTPDEALNNPELMKFVTPRLRADFQLADTFPVYNNFNKLECPITTFSGTLDSIADPSIMNEWKLWTNFNFSHTSYEEHHFFIHTRKKQFTNDINAIINQEISLLNVGKWNPSPYKHEEFA